MIKYKIMVIEDDTALQDLLFHALTFFGYIVEVCPDGKNFLDTFVNIKPDLVILDVNLPDCSGVDIARIIRRNHINSITPIIMISSKQQVLLKSDAKAAGVSDYLSKPFDLPELRDKFHFLLEQTHGIAA